MKKSFAKISDSDLRELLNNAKLNSRGHYICDCLFCGKEKHMYVNKANQNFDCKKCGESGTIIKILKQVGKMYLLGNASIEKRDNIKSINDLSVEEEEEKVEELPNILLPVGFKICFNNRYLLERQIDNKDCKCYEIGETNLLSKLRNYVILPVRQFGKIKGYVARYGDKEVPEDKARYLNSKNNFADMLYGVDDIIPNVTTTVILVEGCFDKISVDNRLNLYEDESIVCCATFGKKISESQIKILKKLNVKNVILLYDFDAIKEIKNYGLQLSKHFKTNITFTNKKDIDECSLEETLQVFSKMYSPIDFNINITGKIKR